MFYNCSKVTTLNLSGFYTVNVEDMSYMFGNCFKVNNLNFSSFNTINVTNMKYMFYQCLALTSLDISSFNTLNVTDMTSMFSNDIKLTKIYVSSAFVTTSVQVEKGSGMFFSCDKLKGGSGTAYSHGNNSVVFAHIDGGSSNPGYFTKKQ